MDRVNLCIDTRSRSLKSPRVSRTGGKVWSLQVNGRRKVDVGLKLSYQ